MKKYYTKPNILALCFFVPLLVMIICMIAFGVEPFGEYSFVIIDGLHQYMPFYSILYDKLKTGESLFYTFRAGMGINFLSLLAYYLSSPLNLVIVLFKRTQLNMVVSWLIAFKIALSGLTAGIYFSSKSKKPDIMVLAVSAAYAMNSYMVGYCWNVMWLDALMIFPIVILGLEKLIEKGDGRLYLLALFYALFCNYYIAYMICIFCVMWFLAGRFKSVGDFLVKGIHFAVSSLLAGGLAAVILVPAYRGIRATASGESFVLPPFGFQTTFSDLVNRQFDLCMPVSHDNFDGNANLYVGMFAVFAFFLFMLNRKIALEDKFRMGLITVILYVSFMDERLNFIWHGFHNQYGIPNRFSFLFCFVLLYMFFRVMQHDRRIGAFSIVLSCLAVSGLIFYAYRYAEAPLSVEIYGLAGMLVVLYAMILFLMGLSRRRKSWYRLAFAFVAVIEICAACVQGFSYIGQINVPKFFSHTEDMVQALDADRDGTFYRSELASAKMVDEAVWYPMNTVGLFGSTARSGMVDIMDSLGFATGCNEYLFKGDTAFTDYLFNVRYQYYKETDNKKSGFTYTDTYGTISSWKNPLETSVGYMVNEDILNWELKSDYPFRVLNEAAYRMFGVYPLFHNIEIPAPDTHSCTAKNTNDGEYYFELSEIEEDNFVFRIPIDRDMGTLYIHYDGSEVERAVVNCAGEEIAEGDLDGHILSCGPVKAGSLLEITMMLKGESNTGYIRLSASEMSEDRFRDVVAIADEGRYRIKDYTERSFTGTVEVKENEGKLLFFSIPYDEGWKITVDGKETEPAIVGNAFLAVPLSEGKHDVDLVFTPPGLKEGCILTAASAVVFLFYAGFCALKKRKRKEKKNLQFGNKPESEL